MRSALAPLTFAAALAAGSPAAMADDISASQIARGRYLATAANCAACHTDFANDGEPWAGGREMHTPFGVIVTPNITPDADTGIGSYSRQDFRRALREGVRRDGANLYPAFPYPYFTRMPEDEIDAIFDYLRTLEPVRAEHVPEAQLPAPLRIRQAVTAWKLLNFEVGEFEPAPDRSAEWNRGAYLVNGPAHCGACHTAKTLTGGDDADQYLRGGVLENWHAPNIRGGDNGGIEHWSEDEITDFLGTGRAGHTVVMPRMGEVVSLSTQHMTEHDRRAIAVYLKSLDDEPRDGGEDAVEAQMSAGRAIFFDNCAACHKSDGGGVPDMFARLDGSNKVNADDPTTVLRVILEGARAQPTEAFPTPLGMPAFAWKLDDRQIADLVTYLRNAWSNDAGPVDAKSVEDLRKTLFSP